MNAPSKLDLCLEGDYVLAARLLGSLLLFRHKPFHPPEHFKQCHSSIIVSFDHKVDDFVPLGPVTVLARDDLGQALLDHFLFVLADVSGGVFYKTQQVLDLLLLLIVFEIHVLAKNKFWVVRQEEKVKFLLDGVLWHRIKIFQKLARISLP